MNRFIPIVLLNFLLLLTIPNLSFGQEEHEHDPIKGCHMEVDGFQRIPGYFVMAEYDYRSDSIDILDYHIRVDVSTFGKINAHTTVSAITKMSNVKQVELDLLDLTIDSVFYNDEKVMFNYDGFKVSFPVNEELNEEAAIKVDVYYQGSPTIDPSNFGGLAFDSDYIYNLGIGLSSDPHNFGRSWFPCFDNFVEKSTYTYEVTHKANEIAHCVGTDMGTEDNNNGTKTTTYRMNQVIPTYLSSMAVSNYVALWSDYEGIASNYPIKLICKAKDSSTVRSAFEYLPMSIAALEDWYGPYIWERVGFVMTTVGAMEHPTNTAYPFSTASSGNPNSNVRLMSHELAHNWWGNMVTLSSEKDMWIKEGNAEYGYHLCMDKIFGNESFISSVRSNHANVIKNAHIDDKGFRALSGMPNEWTYGTTTYNKGASVMHNLRGYMGDEDFKKGQNAILQDYLYGSLDANQYRDKLEEATGQDLDPFFDAWIFEPGFAAYVVDSFNLENENNGKYTYNVFLQQKLYGTDKFHNAVPVSVSFLGKNGENLEKIYSLSGQFDDFSEELDFEIKRIILNRNNLLNIARTDSENLIEKDDQTIFPRTDIRFDVQVFKEPFWARVEHIYGSPDINIVEGDFKISETHYWNIDGDFDASNEIKTEFNYDGSKELDLDFDIAGMAEDSLLLFYRKDASKAWAPLDDVKWLKLNPNDGEGKFKVKNLEPGQYCFGRGNNTTNIYDTKSIKNINIFPNPANDYVSILLDGNIKHSKLNVFNTLGKKIDTKQLDGTNKDFYISTAVLPSGTYFIEVRDRYNNLRFTDKFIVQH